MCQHIPLLLLRYRDCSGEFIPVACGSRCVISPDLCVKPVVNSTGFLANSLLLQP